VLLLVNDVYSAVRWEAPRAEFCGVFVYFTGWRKNGTVTFFVPAYRYLYNSWKK